MEMLDVWQANEFGIKTEDVHDGFVMMNWQDAQDAAYELGGFGLAKSKGAHAAFVDGIEADECGHSHFWTATKVPGKPNHHFVIVAATGALVPMEDSALCGVIY